MLAECIIPWLDVKDGDAQRVVSFTIESKDVIKC